MFYRIGPWMLLYDYCSSYSFWPDFWQATFGREMRCDEKMIVDIITKMLVTKGNI